MSRVGFVGLGIMGLPMSKNLVKAGFDVMVYNRTASRMESAVAAGAQAASSLSQLAESCEVIFTMLPNSPDVKELLLGKDGMADSLKPGTLIIDMTSGAPGDSQEIYAALREKGIRFIDAPVSGGEPMAVSGTLAIMVGGDEADFERALPYLRAMGKSVTRVGSIGSGNICKLTNQVIVALNIAALSEGLMLAKKAGADVEKVFEAMKGGLAGSNVMDAKTSMILSDNYNPGFKLDLHIKDLTNAMHTGSALDAPLPLTAQILEVMKHLSVHGDGSSDHSAIARYYEALGGVAFSD